MQQCTKYFGSYSLLEILIVIQSIEKLPLFHCQISQRLRLHHRYPETQNWRRSIWGFFSVLELNQELKPKMTPRLQYSIRIEIDSHKLLIKLLGLKGLGEPYNSNKTPQIRPRNRSRSLLQIHRLNQDLKNYPALFVEQRKFYLSSRHLTCRYEVRNT